MLQVGELLENSAVRIEVIAGAEGLRRPVRWAQVCELESPWEWVGSGELLLTEGWSFPTEPAAQASFLAEAAAAQLSGVVFATSDGEPALSEIARVAANELAFAVLVVPDYRSLLEVSEFVAEANQADGARRVRRILRMYDMARRANLNDGGDWSLYAALGAELDASVGLVDLVLGANVGGSSLPRGLLEQVRAQLGGGAVLPAVTRISHPSGQVLVIPLFDKPGIVATIQPRSAHSLDLDVLHHLATITSMELDRRVSARPDAESHERVQLREGAGGRETPHDLAAQLSDLEVREPWRAIVAPPAVFASAQLPQRLAYADIPFAWLADAPPDSLIVCPESVAHAVLSQLDQGQQSAAMSEPITDLARDLVDVVKRLRRLARDRERSPRGEPTAGVGGGGVNPLVTRVLGPVIAADRESGSNLMDTLRVYFECDRSIQRMAEVLGLHKQGATYRLKRIESLLGRNFQSLADLTDVYVAYRAWRDVPGD